MEAVPRHEFVPETAREHAYEDRPLDIGQGQVVTAPHLVAEVTELLAPERGHRVLEVGAGSGYHAAVLAELAGAGNVYAVERHPELAAWARRALARTGYGDVHVVLGDGSGGLPAFAPFDRVSVAAAAPAVPEALVDQLADGGRMVVPVGPEGGRHELVLVADGDDGVERTRHGGVRYVPLVGEGGFDEDGR